MGSQLREQLLTAQTRFIQSIMEGPDSLQNFYISWADLQHKIAASREDSSLEEDTISLAHSVATSVSIIGQGVLDVEQVTKSLSSVLLTEWQQVLDAKLPCTTTSSIPPLDDSLSRGRHKHKASLQNLRHPSTPNTTTLNPIFSSRTPSITASVTESSRSASDPNPLPEFIEHAYEFFVTNIFNPYPTRAEKEAIVAQTNNPCVTFSSISNWFSNARRRCGWTAILQERCNGNREQLISLATRVFVSRDKENPVDPKIAQALMDMKESVETMYERKTRTSTWISKLDNLESILHLQSGPSTERQGPTTEKLRREQQKQKKEGEFQSQKRKMQAEALRRAEKVTKMMQGEQNGSGERTASFTTPSPPQQHSLDEELVTESNPVAGGKRKLTSDDDAFHRFPDLRRLSPVSSRSSSFISDISSEGRVPSLTWSDSGDERPYKRSRSSPVTPAASSYSTSPRLSPSLEILSNFDYSFTLEPQGDLTDDPPAFDALFDFSTPRETPTARGKKRSHDHMENNDATPQAKRRRGSQPIIASDGPEFALLPLPSTPPSTPPVPSTPLFTPRMSFDATATQQRPQQRKRSLQLHDLDAILGLDLTQPPPVQIVPPDPSLPLDVGVFDWSSGGFGDGVMGDPQADFSQLMQLFVEDGHQAVDLSNIPQFDLTSAGLPPLQEPTGQHPTLSEDLSGLMSGFMSDEALHDMGFLVSNATPDLSRETSLAPVIQGQETQSTSTPIRTPTPAELADKALKRARKRQELEEKRVALEQERLRLAELERQLEDDD